VAAKTQLASPRQPASSTEANQQTDEESSKSPARLDPWHARGPPPSLLSRTGMKEGEKDPRCPPQWAGGPVQTRLAERQTHAQTTRCCAVRWVLWVHHQAETKKLLGSYVCGCLCVCVCGGYSHLSMGRTKKKGNTQCSTQYIQYTLPPCRFLQGSQVSIADSGACIPLPFAAAAAAYMLAVGHL
jgi:hypothetical protein